MSSRVKINHKRLVAMRKQPGLVTGLTKLAREQAAEANADFDRTASDKDKGSQEHAASSAEPYDVSVRIGRDRVRAYVQTASNAARRHERSPRGSSLLRAAHRGG